jgi:Arc/MetJ-type ribon-helix-helix transcriptional regulator
MRTRHAMTISLPPEMHAQFERVRKAEQRTQSELVREALRLYFNPALAARIAQLPVYTPTASEVRALEKGRAAMRRGEYYTLNEFFRAVDRSRRQARGKGRRARASA